MKKYIINDTSDKINIEDIEAFFFANEKEVIKKYFISSFDREYLKDYKEFAKQKYKFFLIRILKILDGPHSDWYFLRKNNMFANSRSLFVYEYKEIKTLFILLKNDRTFKIQIAFGDSFEETLNNLKSNNIPNFTENLEMKPVIKEIENRIYLEYLF